jgi:hypothetical protein
MPDPSDDPADPRYAPPDLPRYPVADAMLVDPPEGCCPHCGTLLLSAGQRAQDGDGGICISCLSVVISEAGIWRGANYDEAEAWDRDPRVIAARSIWSNLPAE